MRTLDIALIVLLAGAPPSMAHNGESPQEVEEEEQPQAEEPPPGVHWDNGVWLRPRHSNFRMKIGGQAQIDTAGFVSDGSQPVELQDGMEWRRARIYTSGSFGRRWTYKFQWDFTTGRSPNLTDAWLALDFTVFRQKIHLRSGRFSSTFGLENDGSSNDFLFLEQGLTGAFVPPQETGFLVHSESNRRRWDFSFSSSASELECIICAVTGVTGKYSTSFELGREDRRFHAGINYSRRGTDEAFNLAERPESHLAPLFVNTRAFVADRIDVGLGELAYLHGAYSLQSEYTLVRVKRSDKGSPLFHAMYVSASYALTGEARPYSKSRGTIRRIRPKRELRDGAGGLGAFEIAARYSYVDLDDQDIDGGKLWDVTLGVNWYPNYPTRVSFNVVRADREGWKPVWIFQMRLQLAL